MGFAKFLGKVVGDIKNSYLQSNKEHKERIEFEQKEKDEVNSLLDKFEYPDLEDLCEDMVKNLMMTSKKMKTQVNK